MTAYADLEPCDYFHGGWSESLRAVGWLDATTAFPKGPLPADVRAKLGALSADDAPMGIVSMGHHYCELCFGDDEPPESVVQAALAAGRFPSGQIPRCNSVLFIPGRGVIYVAPELVLHYIDEHRYLPPAEFCASVMTCPPRSSRAYERALRRNSTGAFANEFPREWWRFW